MKCAIGLCGHCQFGPAFVCNDGPVFRFRPHRRILRHAGDLTWPERRKPRLAVWKFASCDGCQLSLLDCEDELLAVAGEVDIAYFAEASRRMLRTGPTTSRWSRARSPRRMMPNASIDVRRQSKFLVTIGACATAGGIQALRNFADVKEFARDVYPHPDICRHSRPRRRSAPMLPSISNCAAVRSTRTSCWKSSRPFSSGANRRSPVTASASSARRAAIHA